MKKIDLYKSPVVFNEEDHTYWLGEKQLQGITSTLIHRAFPNKYDGIEPTVLANAAAKGHALHAAIEFFDNFGGDPYQAGDDRIPLYVQKMYDEGLTILANEYLVSDEENYASSIDLVKMNRHDEVCLIDIKSTWNLDRQSTGLQLSFYKRWFERQNPKFKVDHIYALWLPNKDHTICDLIELHPVSDEILDNLIAADLADKPFDIMQTYGSLPALINDVEDEIANIEQQLAFYKDRQEQLKKGLYEQMEKYDIKSFTGHKVKLTRVLPTTSDVFDSKAFKEQYPDIYKQFVKPSQRAGSLKITVTKQK